MILILLGAPGAGKGTQSKVLSAKYGLTHLATGDLFRSEIANKTALGLKAADYVKNGKLVPDELVTEMVAAKLEGGKFLLDGFPRNLEQAQSLATMLARNKNAVDLVVLLNLSREEALKRLTARRVCARCGEVYNVITKVPRAENVCDSCGGGLEQRVDDTEATAQKRLMVFEDLTQPLVQFYKGEQCFQEVNAAQAPEKVTQDLSAVIDTALAGKV
jgi:adenylate kinase